MTTPPSTDLEYEQLIVQGLEKRKACAYSNCEVFQYDIGLFAHTCATCTDLIPSKADQPNLPGGVRHIPNRKVPPHISPLVQGGTVYKHPLCWIISFPKQPAGKGADGAQGSLSVSPDKLTAKVGLVDEEAISTSKEILQLPGQHCVAEISKEGGEHHRPVPFKTGAIRLDRGRDDGEGKPPYYLGGDEALGLTPKEYKELCSAYNVILI